MSTGSAAGAACAAVHGQHTLEVEDAVHRLQVLTQRIAGRCGRWLHGRCAPGLREEATVGIADLDVTQRAFAHNPLEQVFGGGQVALQQQGRQRCGQKRGTPFGATRHLVAQRFVHHGASGQQAGGQYGDEHQQRGKNKSRAQRVHRPRY
jgi:hypothetical protein